jgi:hypothetical protein
MTKYILGGVIAVGFTFYCASSNAQAKEKKMNEALTINRDGAQRNPDIHWPEGQHPEDADLYAHNEIMVNASCETVFANIVDAQSWPSCCSLLDKMSDGLRMGQKHGVTAFDLDNG